jgi:hypothetical protein
MESRNSSKVMKEYSETELLNFGVFVIARYIEDLDKKMTVSRTVSGALTKWLDLTVKQRNKII